MSFVFRWLSTLLLSLVAGTLCSALTLVLGAILSGLLLNESLLLIIILTLSFLAGFTVIIVTRQKLHNTSWIYVVLGVSSIIKFCVGAYLLVRGHNLYENHVSTGFLSDFQFILMKLAGIFVLILGVVTLASAIFGNAARIVDLKRHKKLPILNTCSEQL